MERLEYLEVKNLSFSFGFQEILKDINFKLEKGKVISIVGPSGGGKTTLLHLCSNLLKYKEGTINNTFTNTSFAFQEARLLPWKNVLDNISLGLKPKKINKKTRDEKAKKIAIQFGLCENDFYKFPKDLSGGMKQRVSFARALVTNPSLLFLDEPFSALDIGLKTELQELLINIIEDLNLSILFITHDLMEAIKLSDEILLLKSEPQGHIVKSFKLTHSRLKRDNKYVYTETAKILNDENIIETFNLRSR